MRYLRRLGRVIWLWQRLTLRGVETILTLEVVVQIDLGFFNITEHNTLDRAQWRKWIHVANPN